MRLLTALLAAPLAAADPALIRGTTVGPRAGVAFDPYMNEAPLGPEVGCAVHQLAYEAALELLPRLAAAGTRARRQVWDSLFTGDALQEGMQACVSRDPPPGDAPVAPSRFPAGASGRTLYVDSVNGSDAASGTTPATAVRTVARAIELSLKLEGGCAGSVIEGKQQGCAIVLRGGVHVLTAPLHLGPQHSGLVLQNFAGEEAWLSGAQPLAGALEWEPYTPPTPAPPGSSCPTVCAALGHCCVGDVSSWLHPSCAMGCAFASLTSSQAECVAACARADGHASFRLGNKTFNLAGSCPAGCSAEDGVGECFAGCKIANGVPLHNTWKAKLPSGLGRVWGLHVIDDNDVWNVVQTKARYPNRDPNSGSREYSWASTGPNATWASREPVHDLGDQIVVNATGAVPKNVTVFPDYYVYGANGACARAGYDPPGAYFCSIHGGMHGGDFDPVSGKWTCPGCTDGYPAVFPSALALTNTTGATQKTFPNAHRWPANTSGALLRTWVNGWFTEMWEIASFNGTAIELGRGGFHGGQPHMLDSVAPDGSPGGPDEFLDSVVNVTNRIDPGSMGQVIAENLLAELDAPNEYFVDTAENVLFYAFNGTGKPPVSLPLGAVTLQNLVAVVGSDAGPHAPPTTPVRNITIRGIGIRDAGETYMNPHGAPSGGDWGLQSPQYPEAGAVYISGAEDIRIENCTLKYLDGNAIYLAGYTRGVTITGSELTQIGDSAIALWGWTNSSDPRQPPGTGPDGSAGNQPRGTLIEGCLCHEYGFTQKQSSCVFMAKSMSTTIRGNVMFNAARAHVNQNDGFGLNSTLESNVIYSSCRESSDHGPFNSWDRQPMAWERSAETGDLNYTPLPFSIRGNFFLANYGAGQSVDNDDGSAYYNIAGNVMYAAGGLKSDYAGHDKQFHGNLNIGGGGCGMYCFYQEGHEDRCFNNTFILAHPRPHATSTATSSVAWADLRGCDKTQQQHPRCGQLRNPYGGGAAPVMDVFGNTVLNHNATAADVQCGSDALTAAEFETACGVDVGTSSPRLPSVQEIEGLVRAWLGMTTGQS